MENKLEQLLNKLIEKGWKPFGREKKELKFVDIWKEMLLEWGENYYCSKWYSYRELVSKESNLRQFVCKNGMINNEKLTHTRISQVEWWLDVNCVRKTTSSNYEYRLLESALKDESELEEFLLSNIKVDG